MAALYAATDITQFIRDEINEPVARIFTDTELLYFIDMGAKACSALTLCKETSEDTAIVTAAQYVYTLAENFVRITSCEYVVGNPSVSYGLQRIHPQAWGNVVANTNGQSKYYFTHWGGNTADLYVLPASSAAQASALGIYRVKGYSVVASYGAGGSETLPDGLQLIPLYYALSNVYARLGKHGLSALNMQKFIDECNRWRYDVFGRAERPDSHDLTRVPDITVTQQ